MTGARIGGINWRLARLAVGDSFIVECTMSNWPQIQATLNPAPTRRSPELLGRVFTTELYTAVGAGKLGRIRYIVRVERTA